MGATLLLVFERHKNAFRGLRNGPCLELFGCKSNFTPCVHWLMTDFLLHTCWISQFTPIAGSRLGDRKSLGLPAADRPSWAILVGSSSKMSRSLIDSWEGKPGLGKKRVYGYLRKRVWAL